MWAQLITTRLKPGREGDVSRLAEELEAAEQPGSGIFDGPPDFVDLAVANDRVY